MADEGPIIGHRSTTWGGNDKRFPSGLRNRSLPSPPLPSPPLRLDRGGGEWINGSGYCASIGVGVDQIVHFGNQEFSVTEIIS